MNTQSTSPAGGISSDGRKPSAIQQRSGDSSYLARIRRTDDNEVYVSPYEKKSPPNSSGESSSSSVASVSEPTAGSRTAHPIKYGQQSLAQKRLLAASLNEHRFNTMRDLRNVERALAPIEESSIAQVMSAAWIYYVNSHNLLTELRNITRHYPFSSSCLDEAKRRVQRDSASNQSNNYCWLTLNKIRTDDLIRVFAHAQAAQPEMWGRTVPSIEAVRRLEAAFVKEWSTALAQMLKYLEKPEM